MDNKFHPSIYIDNKRTEAKTVGRMLGLLIKKTGYTSHITLRARHCKIEMQKLYRFWNMQQKHKSKIYKALILSKLTYLPIPTHCLSNAQLQLLQRVHSNGARFIAGISKMARKKKEKRKKKTLSIPKKGKRKIGFGWMQI